MQTNGLQVKQSTEGLQKMGSTDHYKKVGCNLKLVKDDDGPTQTNRLPEGLDDSVRPDENLQNRVDELERQMRLLQQQLENERKLAQVDPLTSIANRRAFTARLQSEVARSERYATPLALVVWDIDHFKRINDTYGHPFGDDVIR
jgi:PleD family two-component response regulator